MEEKNSRLIALEILNQYKPQKTNLSQLINSYINNQPEFEGKSFVRELVWGVVRHLYTIDWVISYLTKNKKIQNGFDVFQTQVY